MANNATQQIVNRAWSFAHVLRDDGLSYMGHTEQITFLLFLKMADEQAKLSGAKTSFAPKGYGWAELIDKDGEALETQYRATLEHLSRQPGMLGEIFKKARPDIQNPATLKRLIVDLIEPQDWLAQEAPWTSRLWVYDLRTNMHFTLKTNPLKRADLDEFVGCFSPENRHERKEGGPENRWRSFAYEELLKRDRLNLDIFWLRDKSLEDSDNLPEPDVLAQEIADDLQTALEQFAAIAAELKR